MAESSFPNSETVQYLQDVQSSIVNGEKKAYIDTAGVEGQFQSLTESGYSVFLDQNKSNSFTAKPRNIVSMSPQATILIKKKAFASMKSVNDLKWMDDTEKMLLRATKALFAIKVQQIRSYESLTKFKDFYEKHNEYNLNLLAQFLDESRYTGNEELINAYYNTDVDTMVQERLEVWEEEHSDLQAEVSSDRWNELKSAEEEKIRLDIVSGEGLAMPDSDAGGVEGFFEDLGSLIGLSATATAFDAVKEDIVKILRRNAFSNDNQLTTWIVDPDSLDNYSTGPGTGAIELTMFTSFTTSCDVSSNPSGASITIENPYRIMTVLEDDIEAAIDEALNGTIGILNDISYGMGSEAQGDGIPPIDGSSIVSAALESAGIGDLLGASTLNMDYIRERMRVFYLGKPFINPADSVSFYIRGNRTTENYGELENPSMASSSFDKSDLEVDDVILKAERELYTNGALDMDTFKNIRKMSDNSFGMVHVFGGFVKATNESFSNGKWSLNIDCVDNMGWLQWSRYCIAPALSDPKGVLEDPLTPFEFKVDDAGAIIYEEGQELIQENKALLESGLLSYDSGLFAGQQAAESNLLQGQYNDLGSLYGTKVLQHPSGFVYRWKTGILTATAGFQVHDMTGENTRQTKTLQQTYGLTVAENVLSNLDVANILSILIIGEPYNVQTFMERSFEAHNRSDNSASSLNPADPLTAVIDAVRRQNNYYGNFQPYRMITMSSSTIQQTISYAGIKETANSNLKILQRRKVAINKQIKELNRNNLTEGNTLVAALKSEVASIDTAIGNQIRVGSQAGELSAEDELVMQFSLFGSNSTMPVGETEEESHDITRAMMLVGAQRRIEDVRLNRDSNLFVVSDQYDNNTDLRPFLLRLNNSGWKLFDGQYTDVYEKCVAATSHLNLEFFCNTQGHLEFRPPLWNRVPYTVLQEAIRIGEEGKSLVPDFITKMFQTRIDSLYLEIHLLNLKIAFIALLFGRYPDKTMIPNMQLSGSDSLEFFGLNAPRKGGVFGDIANFFGDWSDSGSSSIPLTGDLSLKQSTLTLGSVGNVNEQDNTLFGNGINLSQTSQEEKGDVLFGNTDTLLGTFDVIFQESAGILNDVLTAQSGYGSPPAKKDGIATPENLNAVRTAFMKQHGRDPAEGLGIDKQKGFTKKSFIFSKTDGGTGTDGSVIGEDGLLNKMKKAISQRDSLVTILKNNLAKQDELKDIEALFGGSYDEDEDIPTSENTAGFTEPMAAFGESLQQFSDVLSAGEDILAGSAAEGSIFDHLIEDDRRNLLGPGSGKRYIIRDEHIMSARFSETPPDFTRVDVTGDLPLGMAESMSSYTDGLYLWAGGSDFDLWRQYGYKNKEIKVPFISDVESQGRPYAIMELQLQRVGVNRGSVTVAGNEFYQPGDTVFLAEKGLLYYVKSVSHSFSIGQSFTTTLTLTYGHPPGIYLPSPLDVVGQQFTKNPLEQSVITYRNELGDDNYRPLRPDCALVFPARKSGSANLAELLNYADNQLRFTNMMIDLMGSVTGNKYILIRAFVSKADDTEGEADARDNLAIVRSLLENPSQISQGNFATSGADDLVGMFTGEFLTPGGVSTTQDVVPMRLPNNTPVSPIPTAKIIEQTVYLNKNTDGEITTTIRCLDRKVGSLYSTDNRNIDDGEALGILPKGGPSQSSWLDLRKDVSLAKNVIEIGILDIPNRLTTTSSSE
jgi:hypothetical protein